MTRARVFLVLRILGSIAGVLWIVLKVDLRSAEGALSRIPVTAAVAAVALIAANIVIGAVRWRALLSAYGAARIPRFSFLTKLQFVAFFYNNYLPGAVAGDVARGVVTRDCFDEGATGALVVVFVERLLGMAALFVLLACGLALAGSALDAGSLWMWTAIGVGGSVAVVIAIPFARRLAPYLPGPLSKIAGKLPQLSASKPFLAAVGLSFATQFCVAVAGWILLASLAPITLADSLLVVPLAAATAFLPITVGGTGAREAVYVALCGRLFHMAEGDALAASLALWLATLVVAGVGGIAQLIGRRAGEDAAASIRKRTRARNAR
jgi:uncharacterized membrane protein YbhN (UPF0104 family)